MRRHLLAALAVLLSVTSLRSAGNDNGTPAARTPPDRFDLLKYQTPIRNQGGRDTCPYFPPVAALEAAYKRQGVSVDLSVEHLVWLRNVTAGGSNGERDRAENLFSFLGGGSGMPIFRHYAICRAQDMPYQGTEPRAAMKTFGVDHYDWSKPFSQFLLNRWNFDPQVLPPQARANARYGVDKYATMPAADLKDPRKYEQILYSGHEIVFAVNLHDKSDNSATGQPVWRLKPGTNGSSINHFMLMVGYDRNRKFFIVKNQWGPTNYKAMQKRLAPGWKDVVRYNGYTLVDYNYLPEIREASYITKVALVGSSRFSAQRALGLWDVAFRANDKTVLSGVLAWRRVPEDVHSKKPQLRIGDLLTADDRQFRVNAKLDGDGKGPFQTALYIDFNSGAIAGDSIRGTRWRGTLSVPEDAEGTMTLRPAGGLNAILGDTVASRLQFTAKQVGTRNLLMSMSPPK